MIKWLGGGLIVAALTVYGYGSATMLRWLAIYGLFALAVGVFAYNRVITLRRADIPLLALYLWAFLSISWSSDYRTGLYDIVNITALLGVYFAARMWRDIVPLAVTIATVIAIPLIYLFPEDNGGFGNPNFSTEYLLLAIPFILMWGQNRRFIIAFLLLVTIGVTLWYIDSKIELAVFAAIAAYGVYALRNVKLKALIILIATICIVLAFFLTDALSSILARCEIAFNTIVLWLESPVWGHGLGSFGFDYDRVREFHLGYIDKWIIRGASNYAGAAHNEFAQLLSATGIIGFGLLCAFMWQIRGKNLYTAVLGIAVVLALIAFPMQNPWAAMLVVMAAGIATKSSPIVLRKKSNLTYVLLIVAIAMLYNGQRVFAAGYNLGLFYSSPNNLLRAFQYNLAAHQAYPWERYPRMQLAMSVASLAVEYKDRLVLSPEAADKIYEISQTAAAYMPGVLVARGQYLLNSGRFNDPEMEVVMDRLKKHSGNLVVVWLLDAWVGVYKRDIRRVLGSVNRITTVADYIDERHEKEAQRILSFIKSKESP